MLLPRLFSKQDQHPLIPRIKIGELSENGKVLKVLGMERSRQVGIRASSVRLPIEDIHDAIINMDDEKLDADALVILLLHYLKKSYVQLLILFFFLIIN